MDAAEFWTWVGALRERAEREADERFASLSHCSIGQLQDVWRQYRRFTDCYIDDLAILVARSPTGPLRSLLGDILHDELGRGDDAFDHVTMYDRFLTSASTSPVPHASDRTEGVLTSLREATRTRTLDFAIGVRGMGGECECSMYLAVMHRHFRRNVWVKTREGDIDWTFWELHLGELDSDHNRRLRAGVDAILASSPERAQLLADGYQFAHERWNEFWDCVLPVAQRQDQVA
jgi:hypothetical protein